MLELLPESRARVIVLKAAQEVTSEDCKSFMPHLQKTIQEQGKLRILILFGENYRGADLLAFGDLANYAVDHHALEKMALVGAPPWAGGASRLVSILAGAELKSFERDALAAAMEWIET
jgi:hypothetical protein